LGRNPNISQKSQRKRGEKTKKGGADCLLIDRKEGGGDSNSNVRHVFVRGHIQWKKCVGLNFKAYGEKETFV